MNGPIQFERILTRRRIVEELEAIAAEVTDTKTGGVKISAAGVARLFELRRAVEHKPIDIDPQ
jgi:hypothetical protein